MRGFGPGACALLAAVNLAVSVPAIAAPAAEVSAEQARANLDAAFSERSRGNLPGVVALLDPIIATFDAMQTRQASFCAENSQQAMLIVLNAAAKTEKGSSSAPNGKTVVVDEAYCAALFLKGFVLIDMGRAAEAEGFLRRAHETEPYSAHFLNELAEWYKAARQWERAHDLFAEAVEKSEFANEPSKGAFRARGLRGMGFTEIELGKLDDAERHMRESQKYEPESAAARQELDYIASLRKRPST